jgi:hypothetical protein
MLVNKMGSTEGKSVSKHSIGRGWKLVWKIYQFFVSRLHAEHARQLVKSI